MGSKKYQTILEAYNSIYEVIDRPPGSTDKPPYGLKPDPRSTRIVQDLFAKPENKTQTQSSTTSSSTSSTSSQTVAVAGGKGGTVTIGKQYPATLGGKSVNVSYDASGKRTVTPVTSQPSTTTASPSSTSSTATPPAAPQKTFQQELDDLRKASAQATMAGPSKEAQALMSTRAKRLLGADRLKAGIEGQERVEKMKSEIGMPKVGAPKPQSTTTSTQPQPQAPKPPVADRSKDYQRAWDNRNNPFAKGKIRDAWNNMSKEERTSAKEWAKANNKNWQEMGLPESIDIYDEVLNFLLSEGYSHKEATSIMVNEGWFQDLLGAAKKRLSNPLKTAATDAAATAIATTPAQSVRPALPPQPAPIVRQVAAPVTPNPLQQLKAPVNNVINVVRQLKSAKSPAGSLPQGKPGGNIIPSSKPGAVTPSTKPVSGITNASGSSSVVTRSGSSQVSTTGANVRTPGGPLAKAGPVIDVQPRLSGTPSVQRLSPSQVLKFKPSVKLTGGGAAGPLTGLKGGVAGSIISLAAQPVIDDLAKRGAKATFRTIAALRGKTEKAQQLAPSLYDKQGPDLTTNIVSGVRNREKPEVSGVGPLPRVAAPYTPARPPASKVTDKKVEVKPAVSEKPKLTPIVKKPVSVKPVDPRLQKYRDLIKQGMTDTAEKLGKEIYADKYGIPTAKTA